MKILQLEKRGIVWTNELSGMTVKSWWGMKEMYVILGDYFPEFETFNSRVASSIDISFDRLMLSCLFKHFKMVLLRGLRWLIADGEIYLIMIDSNIMTRCKLSLKNYSHPAITLHLIQGNNLPNTTETESFCCTFESGKRN